jgi:hypothetical protein
MTKVNTAVQKRGDILVEYNIIVDGAGITLVDNFDSHRGTYLSRCGECESRITF